MNLRRFGLHASTAGGLDNAAHEAIEAGANCLQIFSSSPRMWRASALDHARVRAFRTLREKHDLHPLAIHCNYLINLASADPGVLRLSLESFRGELARAVAIGADFLVVHPGSIKGHESKEAALQLAAASVGAAATGIEPKGLRLLIENTAGSGQAIGSTFEDLSTLAALIRKVTDFPLGFCIDTCHCYAAGYDVATQLDLVLRGLDAAVGLDHVHLIHANDSKGELGSHLDRHANIGEGKIGEAGFRGIVNHSGLATKAFVLETPMEDGLGVRDLATLRRLVAA
ncbi:MAG: deoxyribonuclease IV [Bryobacteraceae bacterium]